MRYFVKIYRHGGNYSAMVPDLPGCVAAADTIEETRTLIAEAIGLHLELMRRNGEPISKPAKHVDLNVDDLVNEELCTWVDVGATPRRDAPRKKVSPASRKR
jgi:predicted RNase H-like HicB family nuclease